MHTIFVVDDSDSNLTKAKQVLEGYYRVFTIPSASKMFSLLQKVKPNLILLDIEMPEMNGYKAIKLLKADPETASIPVIFLTANVDEKSELEGFSLGAVDYIYKPFSDTQLLNRVASQVFIACLVKELPGGED
ncbi:MAG: response regulator [Holophagales bacterium]|jgi:putative two-component system response regulator|nr:response regulator [Holophagales bacterium]